VIWDFLARELHTYENGQERGKRGEGEGGVRRREGGREMSDEKEISIHGSMYHVNHLFAFLFFGGKRIDDLPKRAPGSCLHMYIFSSFVSLLCLPVCSRSL
jgi:hypothetical protein